VSPTRVCAAAVALIASLAVAATTAAAPPPEAGARPVPKGKKGERPKPPKYPRGTPGVGARSAGDRLFPQIGNGGYDVQHYDLRLSYDPATDVLSGRALITARATRQLRELSLDLQGFTVSRVLVNGKAADFRREGTKLIIRSKRGALPAGKLFTVLVRYSGVPQPITDPDGSQEGWFHTDDGAFVVGEPIGAQGWFPNNNTPRDKATFDVRTTVPSGITVIGNGSLVGTSTSGDSTTWHWRETHPMSTYLATSTLGVFDVTTGTAPGGVDVFNAVDSAFTPTQKERSYTALNKQPAIVGTYDTLYGAYPFDTVGGAVDRAGFVGYALESQSISNYDRPPSSATVAHEVAHQWYGNSVTPREWVDIWLNEGFATWVQWDWSFRADGNPNSPAARWNAHYARPADDELWEVAPANPAADEIFHEATYVRGAMTLEGLRQIVGDATFFEIMRRWHEENEYGVVTTADFIALAERVSGRELSPYFQDWLYEVGKPSITPASYSG
jgi:aminopeptidase N